MGGGVVTVGLLLSAIGFGGKCVARKLPKVTSQISQKVKLISISKYYEGGFEPSMTRKEACLILGISSTDHLLKVKEAHKRMILLNHPDRGGSPYLAAKINEAKQHIARCKL